MRDPPNTLSQLTVLREFNITTRNTTRIYDMDILLKDNVETLHKLTWHKRRITNISDPIRLSGATGYIFWEDNITHLIDWYENTIETISQWYLVDGDVWNECKPFVSTSFYVVIYHWDEGEATEFPEYWFGIYKIFFLTFWALTNKSTHHFLFNRRFNPKVQVYIF